MHVHTHQIEHKVRRAINMHHTHCIHAKSIYHYRKSSSKNTEKCNQKIV